MLPGTKVEVEIINPAMRHEDGYYVVSITKLLQQATWETLLSQSNTDEVITVVPTEANLG
jgi:ribosomal protein S1